jgi:hypothetical protein
VPKTRYEQEASRPKSLSLSGAGIDHPSCQSGFGRWIRPIPMANGFDYKEVIILSQETIRKQDSETRIDCECNALSKKSGEGVWLGPLKKTFKNQSILTKLTCHQRL